MYSKFIRKSIYLKFFSNLGNLFFKIPRETNLHALEIFWVKIYLHESQNYKIHIDIGVEMLV